MRSIAGAILVLLLVVVPFEASQAKDESEWKKIYAEAEKQYLQAQYGPSLEKAREAQAFAEKNHGAESQQVAMSLSMIGVVLQTVGQIDQAETVIKQAMAMREKVLGAKHADYAESLNNLAVLYRAQGRLVESESLDVRALAIREAVLGPEHDDTVQTLNNLGAANGDLGRFTQGESLLLKAIAIYEKKYGPREPKLITSLNNLAEIYRKQGRYDQAEAYYRRTIGLVETLHGSDHPNAGIYNNNLAQLYFDQGHYSQAKTSYQKSLEIFKKKFGDTHPLVAVTFNNVGNVELKLGRYEDAERLYLSAQAILVAAFGPNHPQVAATLSHLGLFYHERSRYAEAEAMHLQALPIMEKAYSANHPRVARSLSNLALVYSAQGNYDQALPLFQRVLAIREKALGKDHSDIANVLNNLGNVYFRTGNYGLAEPVLKRAIAVWEKSIGPEYSDIAIASGHLASVYVSQKKYIDAERLYERALAITEKTQGPGHPLMAANLSSLGDAYFAQEQYARAESFYKRSLSIWRAALGEDHYQTAAVLNNLATVHQRRGSDQKALDMMRNATTILRRRYVTADSNPAQGNLTEQKSNRNAFIGHLESLSRIRAKGKYKSALASEGFEIAQLSRASSVSQSVAQMAARFAQGGDALAELVRAQQDIRDAQSRASKSLLDALSQPSDKRNAEIELKLRQEIVSLNEKLDSQNTSIASRFPKYQTLISQEPVAVAEIQKLLAADEAMLVYAVSGTKTFAWVVTREAVGFHSLAAGSEDIEKQVQFLRSKLLPNASGQLSAMTPATSSRLSQGIFAPLESSLIGIRHILLVPDGALQSLPFGVLSSRQGDAPEWLAMRYAFSVLPSVSALRALRAFNQSETGKLPFAGFGDPVLTGDAGGTRNLNIANVFKQRNLEATGQSSFLHGLADVEILRKAPPLPETGDELRAISKVLNGTSDALFLGKQATETLVKQSNLADYRFLAFATHGVMAGELSGVMEPGLVLTPPASGSAQDDGYLSASEVAQLKLNADWVLLSACNTAAPDGTPGAEGLSGLAKAFFYAGSRSLLVSHWPVASEATQLLVTDTVSIYANTPQIGKAEAIKQAMGRMMEKPEYAHPFYWGAFVVVGE